MYNVKSFIKEYTVNKAINSDNKTVDVIQTNEPCVLISAKDLYRMIHRRDQSVANKVTDFINKLKDVQTLSDYDNKLSKEIESIQVDIYCKNELEDAAFMTGDYKQPVPVAHKNAV